MIERLYSAVKRRRWGRATTSESGTAGRGPGAWAPAALAASPLRSEAANAANEVLVLLVLIKVRFLSPPYSNYRGATCLTHLGTEGLPQPALALFIGLAPPIDPDRGSNAAGHELQTSFLIPWSAQEILLEQDPGRCPECTAVRIQCASSERRN